jgi:hypothetical protein
MKRWKFQWPAVPSFVGMTVLHRGREERRGTHLKLDNGVPRRLFVVVAKGVIPTKEGSVGKLKLGDLQPGTMEPWNIGTMEQFYNLTV